MKVLQINLSHKVYTTFYFGHEAFSGFCFLSQCSVLSKCVTFSLLSTQFGAIMFNFQKNSVKNSVKIPLFDILFSIDKFAVTSYPILMWFIIIIAVTVNLGIQGN